MSEFVPVPEPSATRLVGTLTFAGMMSGLVLAAVYQVTLPAIQQNAAAALRSAVLQVVPGATSMQKLVLQGEQFVLADGSEPRDATAVYAAHAGDGRFLGYAIPGQGPGFQDTITLIYGYDPTRRCIVGMQVLDSRETPGLGDKIFKDPAFVGEFQALAVAPEVVVVKHGAGMAAHEVDGITGATISSKAVVRIVNLRNRALLARLPDPATLPPPAKEGAR